MAEPLRVGVVGAGAVAQIAHLPVLRKIKSVDVRALCDSDVPKARALAQRFAINDVFDDIEELLRYEELDAVVIGSPTHLHESHLLAALAANVPRAIAATLNEPGVGIAGGDEHYPAIFIEPRPNGLQAHGVLASGAGDLFRHGWAWLSGDFRNGPSEPLAVRREMRLEAEGPTIELLVDGEKHEATSPLDLHADLSAVRFFAARGDVAWR